MMQLKIFLQSSLLRNRSQRGFTLIELSIVLVIIGLIVGGVLVGRTLIKAAEVRSAASYLQSLTAGMNTFRMKYDCIAGDCTTATNFIPQPYLNYAAAQGCSGNGNGNGNINVWHCESMQAAQSLLVLKLIPVFKDSSANNIVTIAPNSHYMLGINNNLGYFYFGDLYNAIQPLYNTFTWASFCQGTWVNSYAISPNQAQQIDAKMDDGIPATGLFMGLDAALPTCTAAAILANSCVTPSGSYVSSDNMGCRSIYVLK